MDRIRIVPLGTSAGTPTSGRNVSSLALFLDGRALLLDCGEGTQHQIIRSRYRIGSLDAILITHLHGDHVYGLPGLLATLSMEGRTRSLPIYGPARLGEFLDCAIEISHLRLGYGIELHETTAGVVRKGEGYSILAAPLEHRMETFGYAIVEDERPGRFDLARAIALGLTPGPAYRDLARGGKVRLADGRTVESHEVVGSPRPGRRVVYCSDTRPCAAAVELARGADLLVHESTYAEEHADRAAEYRHSTAREAAGVARDAGVRRLMLTHFSPRYTDVAVLVAEAGTVFPDVFAAGELEEVEVPRTEEF